MEEKRILSLKNHIVQQAEVGGGSCAFQPTQAVRGRCLRYLRQQVLQLSGNSTEPLSIHSKAMVTVGALNTPATVKDFAEDHHPCHSAALRRIIGHTILGTAQQHIALCKAGCASQEFSPRRAKGHGDALFRTGTHQRRGCAGIGKGYNALKCVQRIPLHHLALPVGDHVFTLQRKIHILGGDKEGIQKLSHGSPSIALRR